MKILRRGTFANHGTSSIEFKKISVSWNEKESAVEVRSSAVSDFVTDSTHNYRVIIPLVDLAKIIKSLGVDGVGESPSVIEAALEGEVKSLHRILAAASGLVSQKDIDA